MKLHVGKTIIWSAGFAALFWLTSVLWDVLLKYILFMLAWVVAVIAFIVLAGWVIWFVWNGFPVYDEYQSRMYVEDG